MDDTRTGRRKGTRTARASEVEAAPSVPTAPPAPEANRRPAHVPDLRRRLACASVGLGCWIATLLLYSNTITPFQRFAGTGTFVGDFAPQVLGIAAAAALALAVAAMFGRFVPRRALLVVGGVLYVGAAAGFGAACLLGVPDGAVAATWALSAASALGSVGTGLAWGRAFKGFAPRASLAAVALAAAVAAALGVLAIAAPPGVCAGLFTAEALVAAVLPAAVGCRNPACEEASLTPEGLRKRPVAERLRSFAGVAAPALIGLLAFAFVMGTMRGLIVDTFPIHIGVLLVCAAILGVFAFGRNLRPLTRTAYRSLIPTLAVLLLAATNITAALSVGSSLDTAFVFLLYTLAALLTLATLAAIAHADEFPSDLVFSIALMLFCTMSLAGVGCSPLLTDEAASVSTTVITTVYAFAMVLVTGLRTGRAAADGGDRFDGLFDEDATAGGSGAGTGLETPAAAGTQALPHRASVGERCAQLARDYHLTPREGQILTYLAEGHGSGYIGEALYISPNTVRTHVHNLYRKLGVGSREEVLELTRR